MDESSTTKLPALFLSHGGGPCFWMDWDPPDSFDRLAALFRGLPSTLGGRPRAVLVISAHWEEEQFTVQSSPRPPLLYDYYGFPEHTYRLEYPAPGLPALATRVRELLTEAGLPSREDPSRGFDHGVFVPFLLIYPRAEVPIIQISMKAGLDPAEHFRLGRALAPLRREGVLIVGSGLTYHNLRRLRDPLGASEPFDRYLADAVCDPDSHARERKLIAWESAPMAREAHPREDHLVPLFVVAGAAGEDSGRVIYSEKMKNWGFRSSCFRFG